MRRALLRAGVSELAVSAEPGGVSRAGLGAREAARSAQHVPLPRLRARGLPRGHLVPALSFPGRQEGNRHHRRRDFKDPEKYRRTQRTRTPRDPRARTKPRRPGELTCSQLVMPLSDWVPSRNRPSCRPSHIAGTPGWSPWLAAIRRRPGVWPVSLAPNTITATTSTARA